MWFYVCFCICLPVCVHVLVCISGYLYAWVSHQVCMYVCVCIHVSLLGCCSRYPHLETSYKCCHCVSRYSLCGRNSHSCWNLVSEGKILLEEREWPCLPFRSCSSCPFPFWSCLWSWILCNFCFHFRIHPLHLQLRDKGRQDFYHQYFAIHTKNKGTCVETGSWFWCHFFSGVYGTLELGDWERS